MKFTLRKQLYIALMVAILAVTSQFSIPLGSVPITLQTLFIVITGVVLGPLNGAIALVVYLLLGAVGLPVFAGFAGGVNHFVGPTGGFLFAFPLMAALCGVGLEKPFWFQILMGLVALTVLHTAGVVVFMFVMKTDALTALSLATLPYLIKDVLSVGVGVVVGRAIATRLAVARAFVR